MNDRVQQQTQRIYENIALLAIDFLPHHSHADGAMVWLIRRTNSTIAPKSRMGQHNAEPTLSPPTDLPDRYGGGAPGDQKKVRRYAVEFDAHRDALPARRTQLKVGLTNAN